MQLLDFLKQTGFVVSDSQLEEVEKQLLSLPKTRENALIYNEFRIANAGRHQNRRPQILTSGLFNPNIPNLHTSPLMYYGDVVLLACSYEPFNYKSVINCYNLTLFFEILQQLPEGFHPDFYWDNQVEKDHYVPKGIEMAPFPTFASVCHSYYHLSIEHICPLFDRILPLSPIQGAQLKKKFPGKILDLPFGLNWASFDLMISPYYDKTIDVCVLFGPREDPTNKERRKRVIEMAKAFEKKYAGRFSFVFAYDLPLNDYADLLLKSLITINIAGAHGPYNYRTVEALCTGSLIFEANWSDGFFKNNFQALFQEGVHGVSFTFETFEEKLLYYLTHREEAQQIAKQGLAFLKEHYSYEKLFSQIYQEAKKIDVTQRPTLPPGLGYFHADMIYYYQANRLLDINLSYGVLQAYHEPLAWVRALNEMIYLDLPKESLGSLYALSLQTDRLANLKTGDLFILLQELYQQALKAPLKQRWLVEWTFFLICFKRNKSTPKQLEHLKEHLLQDIEPFPDHAIFKYSIDEEENSRYYNLYFDLNLKILKVMDQPKERAALFRQYALDYLELITPEIYH